MNSDYRIDFSQESLKKLSKLDKTTARRIVQAIEELKSNPYNHVHSKKMKGYDGVFYQLRIGDFRVIYEVIDDKLLILVVRIGPRGDVYK